MHDTWWFLFWCGFLWCYFVQRSTGIGWELAPIKWLCFFLAWSCILCRPWLWTWGWMTHQLAIKWLTPFLVSFSGFVFWSWLLLFFSFIFDRDIWHCCNALHMTETQCSWHLHVRNSHFNSHVQSLIHAEWNVTIDIYSCTLITDRSSSQSIPKVSSVVALQQISTHHALKPIKNQKARTIQIRHLQIPLILAPSRREHRPIRIRMFPALEQVFRLLHKQLWSSTWHSLLHYS